MWDKICAKRKEDNNFSETLNKSLQAEMSRKKEFIIAMIQQTIFEKVSLSIMDKLFLDFKVDCNEAGFLSSLLPLQRAN